MLNPALEAAVSAADDATNEYAVPARSMERSPKVARPSTALTVFVPDSVPPPGFTPSDTASASLAPLTRLPRASRTSTCTAGVSGCPAVPLGGGAMKASCAPACATVSVPWPVTPSTVAVIVAVPLATAVATPVAESIVATAGCIDRQRSRFPRISDPLASFATAANGWASPSAVSVTLGGDSSTVATTGGSVPHAQRAPMTAITQARGRGRTETSMRGLLAATTRRGCQRAARLHANAAPGLVNTHARALTQHVFRACDMAVAATQQGGINPQTPTATPGCADRALPAARGDTSPRSRRGSTNHRAAACAASRRGASETTAPPGVSRHASAGFRPLLRSPTRR